MREELRGNKSGVLFWLGNRDLKLLLSLLVIVASIWGFVELAGEVTEGDTRKLDEALLLALRREDDPAEPRGPKWLKEAVRDVTALGSTTVLVFATVVAAGGLVMRGQWHAALLLCTAMAGGLLLNSGLKAFFDRPRPDLVPHFSHVDSPSFPSGHTLLATVGYLTLGTIVSRLVAERHLKFYILGVAVVITFLVGVSRIFLGVHYPTDVLGGWAVGLGWSVLCWLTARYLQRRGAVEQPK